MNISRRIATLGIAVLATATSSQAVHISARPVTDLNTAGDSSPQNLKLADTKLFFTAKPDGVNPTLYMKNMLKGKNPDLLLDRAPLKLKRLPFEVTDPPVVKGFPGKQQIFFHVNTNGLWTSRGTTSTTKLLKKVDIDLLQSGQNAIPFPMSPMTVYKDLKGLFPANASRIFFGAYAKNKSYEVWSSNGTAMGTKVFKDINTNNSATPLNAGSFPYQFTDMRGTLLFGAKDASGKYQLWKSLGTAAKTTKVTTTLADFPLYITRTGSTGNPGANCYFNAPGQTNPTYRELWFTDGTPENTVCVTDGQEVQPAGIAAAGDRIFFSGHDTEHGTELWSSSESYPSTTTAMVSDICPGTEDSRPWQFTDAGQKGLYFAASPAGVTSVLYRLDLTNPEAIPEQVTTTEGAPIANPMQITPALDASGTGTVYFIAATGLGSAPILWSTENSPGATASPVLTEQENHISSPENLQPVILAGTDISRLYFTAPVVGEEFGNKGTEVWVYQP